MSKTPEQWLALGDDLPLELAKLFTPRPWAHNLVLHGSYDLARWVCKKCKQSFKMNEVKSANYTGSAGYDWCKGATEKPCSVPDPITIDWNTAMERFRAMRKTKYTIKAMHRIYRLETGVRATLDRTLLEWFLFTASKEALLIAAAIAEGEPK